MVKVRLYRTGSRGSPSYRIVAIDSRDKRQGRVLEFLGTYQPLRGGTVDLKEASLQKWIDQGAQVSDTVAALVRRLKRSSAAQA